MDITSLTTKVSGILPLTQAGKDMIANGMDIKIGTPDNGSSGQTLIGDPSKGKTAITIANGGNPGQTQSTLTHEIFNAFFLRGKIDPKAFNAAYEEALNSGDDNSKIISEIETYLNDPKNAAAFQGKTGENIKTGDPYYLASERFAYIGERIAEQGGLSSLPPSLQKFYKPFLTDFNK